MSGLQIRNPRVQSLRRLLSSRSERAGTRRFVAEGPVAAAEAVASGWRCVEQFVSAGSSATVEGAGDVVELAEGVLERVGSTRTPQEPLVVVELPAVDTAALLERSSFVVVLHQVADPGNVGTILRSAEAAGADAVVLTAGSVDHLNPKAVRASAGAIFHVPVVTAELEHVSAAGLELVGTSSHVFPGRTVDAHTGSDLTGRLAIVMGNEAAGLPAEWTDDRGPIDRWVTIPHHGRSESLNVAMATTVLAFEVARQRHG